MAEEVYVDMVLTCKDCGEDFPFSERDQKFYASKSFEKPKRCKRCRELRKLKKAEQDAHPNRNQSPTRDWDGNKKRRRPRSGNR